MFSQVKQSYKLVNELVDLINDPELTVISKFLGKRIANPESYVVLLGETSSGKSTLINGLLKRHEMFTSVKPSTAAVTEIAFSDDASDGDQEYYAINKNATMEIISRQVFKELMINPDERLARLRLITAPPYTGLKNMRLFDTPGYGSIIEKHDEILYEFIPNSDLVIYVVSYKVGIQADDYDSISHSLELMNEDTKFVLVINMCPPKLLSNDPRIKEITAYVEDLTHQRMPVFCAPYEVYGDDEYPLPACEKLWDYIQNAVTSPEHYADINKSFSNYVLGLLEKCEATIHSRILIRDLSVADREFLDKKVLEIKETNEDVKSKMIEPTFKKLIQQIPGKLEEVMKNVIKEAEDKIDQSSKLDKDELMVYINQHLLRFATNKQINEVQFFIENTLDDLDRKIDDKLNKEYSRLEKEIELHFSLSVDNLAKNILRGQGGRILENALLGYFKQFAGRGGTGIANAAKHGLKVVGDMFGHTFKRETHNALAHTLSKIGATSARAVTIAVAVIIEALIIIYDIETWQKKLKESVRKGIGRWYVETLTQVENDLRILKDTNLQLLDDETNSWILEYEKQDELTVDFDKVDELEERLKVTKKQLEGLFI